MEKEYWYYIVRQDYLNEIGESLNYYWHENKSEALKRADKFMKMSIENLCTDYKMGKIPAGGLHKIIFRLSYSESFDGGITYSEILVEEIPLAHYLGNRPVE